MRIRLILFFILISKWFYSQSSPVSLYFGYHICSDNYYNQLNSLNKFSVNKPFSLLSASFTEYVANRKYQKIKFNCFLPAHINIQDSIKFKMLGFSFDYNFSYDLIKKKPAPPKKKLFYLLIGLGFSAGQYYLKSGDLCFQKNPYFSPKINIQPIVRVKYIMLSLNVDYCYDVSKLNWKSTRFNSKNVLALNGFKQTGLSTLLGVGYFFN